MALSGSVFKSVCEDILEPRGVKVGGYKEEIFYSLCEKEREELSCQICFMVVKDAHTCTNKHLFCGTCIFAWSMTSASNTDRCPVCRVRGAYCSDEPTSSKIASMAIKCLQCKWKGHIGDYRSHPHGLEDVGIDPKMAGLPSLWSDNGDIVFPDLTSSEDLEETVESSRRRHQRRHLDTQLNLIEGRARLAFLLDIFEEDLQRHRDDLSSLVRLQQRYNDEQFNEIMRLESELGQQTANLLRLIESANRDVDEMTSRLRSDRGRGDVLVRASGTPSLLRSTINRLSTSSLGHPGSALTPAEEPREPVRRARFFRLSSGERPQISTEAAAANPGSTIDGASNRLLTRRENYQRNNLENLTRESDFSSHTQVRMTPTLSPVSSISSSNPFSITYPPQQTSVREQASLPTTTPTPHRPIIAREQATPTPHRPIISSESATPTPHRPIIASESAAPHPPMIASEQTTVIPHPPIRSREQTTPTPRPPIRASAQTAVASANPFTITWPPAAPSSNASTSPNRLRASGADRGISRQELRQNGLQRSRRTGAND